MCSCFLGVFFFFFFLSCSAVGAHQISRVPGFPVPRALSCSYLCFPGCAAANVRLFSWLELESTPEKHGFNIAPGFDLFWQASFNIGEAESRGTDRMTIAVLTDKICNSCNCWNALCAAGRPGCDERPEWIFPESCSNSKGLRCQRCLGSDGPDKATGEIAPSGAAEERGGRLLLCLSPLQSLVQNIPLKMQFHNFQLQTLRY